MSSPSEPVGHRLDVVGRRGIAEAHDRAFAELLLDLAQRGGQCLLAVLVHAWRSMRGGPSGESVRR